MSPCPDPPGRPSERSPEDEDPERALLRRMEAAGVDPDRETTVTFSLYFRTEADALAAAVLGRRERYTAFVGDLSGPFEGPPEWDWLQPSRDSPSWVCELTRRVAPSRATLHATGARFEALARRFGGKYGGWDVIIDP